MTDDQLRWQAEANEAMAEESRAHTRRIVALCVAGLVAWYLFAPPGKGFRLI